MSIPTWLMLFFWGNFSVLVWIILLYPPVTENISAYWAAGVFFLLAVVFSGASSSSRNTSKTKQEKNNDRTV